MRNSKLVLALAIAALPSGALAAGCPDSVSDEVKAELGEPVAWLEAGQTVHTVDGLTILDKPVSYAVLKRDGDDGDVIEIDYRFADMVRPVGDPYPADLRKAFDRDFKFNSCGKSRDPVCTIAFQSETPGNGRISGSKLSMGDLWIPDDARGPGLPIVQADFDLKDGDPVYLVCLY